MTPEAREDPVPLADDSDGAEPEQVIDTIIKNAWERLSFSVYRPASLSSACQRELVEPEPVYNVAHHCDECSHEWTQEISERVVYCPKCRGSAIKEDLVSEEQTADCIDLAVIRKTQAELEKRIEEVDSRMKTLSGLHANLDDNVVAVQDRCTDLEKKIDTETENEQLQRMVTEHAIPEPEDVVKASAKIDVECPTCHYEFDGARYPYGDNPYKFRCPQPTCHQVFTHATTVLSEKPTSEDPLVQAILDLDSHRVGWQTDLKDILRGLLEGTNELTASQREIALLSQQAWIKRREHVDGRLQAHDNDLAHQAERLDAISAAQDGLDKRCRHDVDQMDINCHNRQNAVTKRLDALEATPEPPEAEVVEDEPKGYEGFKLFQQLIEKTAEEAKDRLMSRAPLEARLQAPTELARHWEEVARGLATTFKEWDDNPSDPKIARKDYGSMKDQSLAILKMDISPEAPHNYRVLCYIEEMDASGEYVISHDDPTELGTTDSLLAAQNLMYGAIRHAQL